VTYYYFLARPRHDVTTTITVTNLVPNSLGRSIRSKAFDIAVYTFRREVGCWQLRASRAFEDLHHVTISSEEVGLGVGEIAVAVPVPPEFRGLNKMRELAEPMVRTIDDSPVATRCSLRFHWSGIASSYQSEYPLGMADRVSGSVSSFNLSSISQGQGATVLFCAINITRDPIKGVGSYTIVPADRDGVALKDAATTALRNACTTIETNPREAAQRLVYLSDEALFLPIYVALSHSEHGPEMSVEHTHPPHEMFWRQPAQGFCLPRLRASWKRD
jgi:hypothetical protein